MNTLLKLVLILYVMCFAFESNAQELLKIESKVTDEKSKPLHGVTIYVKEDNRLKTQTDVKGEFILNVKDNQTIVLNLMGYLSQEILAKKISDNPIILAEDLLSIGDVVVVGYGKTKKSDVTGSVATVSVNDMTKSPVISVEDMLAGRVAGLQVTSNSGQPGDDINIVIRGGNSLTQDNSPLYVVDGVPLEGFDLGSLNPNDIESISVLKDASSTAIYGARGANGVIVITTKTGLIGAGIVYDGFTSLSQVSKKMDMMDPYEYVKYELERSPGWATNKFLTKPELTLEDYKSSPVINWQDHLFQDARAQNHNLFIHNNTEKGNYFVSANVAKTDGVIVNSGRNREKIRASFRQQLFNNLTFSNRLYYTHDKNWGTRVASEGSTSNVYMTYLMARVWAFRPTTLGGSPDILDELYDLENEDSDEEILSGAANMNPIIGAKNEIRTQDRNTIFLSSQLDYRISNEFELNIRGGYVNKMFRNEAFYNSSTIQGRNSTYNELGQHGFFEDRKVVDWSNEYLLNYRKIKSDHEITGLVGFTLQGTNFSNSMSRSIRAEDEQFGIISVSYGAPSVVNMGVSKNTLMSYFGRADYNYKSKYLLTINMRADGSSKFSPANRWGYFPSGAIAYNIAREDFLEGSTILNDFKIRASYGITGNNRLPDFAREQAVSLDDFYSLTSGTDFKRVIQIPNDMGNSLLKWEETEQADLGVDISLFNNRLSIIADVYRKRTNDLILNANLPRYVGFTKAYMNVGSVENKGLELSFSSLNFNKGDFLWTTNFNISFNKSKVLGLNVGEDKFDTGLSFGGSNWASPIYRTEVGQPVGQFIGYKWLGNYQYEDFNYDEVNKVYVLKDDVVSNITNRAMVKPGDVKYEDQNGDLVLDASDVVVLGNALPKHYGGLINNFNYKNFGLSVFFQWNYGNEIMNANRLFFEGNPTNQFGMNQFASYSNRWTPENPTNDNYRVGGKGPSGAFSDKVIEDGSFLRLRTVQLSYTLPKHWISKLNRVHLYVSGQNLFTWTNYTGLDPEVSVRSTAITPGFDYSAYARSKVYACGIKVEI